ATLRSRSTSPAAPDPPRRRRSRAPPLLPCAKSWTPAPRSPVGRSYTPIPRRMQRSTRARPGASRGRGERARLELDLQPFDPGGQGAGEVGVAQVRAGEVGAAEVGVGEDGAAQVSSAQV